MSSMVLCWSQLNASPSREYLADGLETFGRLRIINEDRVTAGNGFGFHHHQEMEIFSYLVQGELKQ
jgi:redox-sensitive bicupin YhaK (pirin superfamily)